MGLSQKPRVRMRRIGALVAIGVVGAAGAGIAANAGAQGTGTAFTCENKIATLVGTNAGEAINGTAGDDVIVALGGNDSVDGGGGNDTVCLGDGDDKANGGDGNDRILGEAGNDRIVASLGDDAILGGAGRADHADRDQGADPAHSDSRLLTEAHGNSSSRDVRATGPTAGRGPDSRTREDPRKGLRVADTRRSAFPPLQIAPRWRFRRGRRPARRGRGRATWRAARSRPR